MDIVEGMEEILFGHVIRLVLHHVVNICEEKVFHFFLGREDLGRNMLVNIGLGYKLQGGSFVELVHVWCLVLPHG